MIGEHLGGREQLAGGQGEPGAKSYPGPKLGTSSQPGSTGFLI